MLPQLCKPVLQRHIQLVDVIFLVGCIKLLSLHSGYSKFWESKTVHISVSHLQIKHLWFLDSFSVTALIKLRSCFSVVFGMIWATSAAYMDKFYRNV